MPYIDLVRTWCIISFRISIGRSSSLSGPFAAFSLPFGAAVVSPAGGALAARATGALVHALSVSACIVMACALSCEGALERARSSAGAKGDAGLGVPGAEGGEEAMLISEVRAGTAEIHTSFSSERSQAKRQHTGGAALAVVA